MLEEAGFKVDELTGLHTRHDGDYECIIGHTAVDPILSVRIFQAASVKLTDLKNLEAMITQCKLAIRRALEV